MKQCSACKIEKPVESFSKRSTNKDGLQHYCKSCAADSKLQTRYGVSREAYNELLKKQGNRCAICDIHKDDYAEQHKVHRFLVVDHNHSTGAVRGLLCNNCNISIGAMRDSPLRLRRAAEYLETRG